MLLLFLLFLIRARREKYLTEKKYPQEVWYAYIYMSIPAYFCRAIEMNYMVCCCLICLIRIT